MDEAKKGAKTVDENRIYAPRVDGTYTVYEQDVEDGIYRTDGKIHGLKQENTMKNASDIFDESTDVLATVDPVLEAIAKKLSGITRVPPLEQGKMIKRAAKAGAEALRKG